MRKIDAIEIDMIRAHAEAVYLDGYFTTSVMLDEAASQGFLTAEVEEYLTEFGIID